jgi:hypothetical protein
MAYLLVTLVQKHFFNARSDAEIAIITDAIGILEGHARNERSEVDVALGQLQRLQDEHRPRPVERAPSVPPPTSPRIQQNTPPRREATDSPASDLGKLLEDKRKAIKERENERQSRLGALNSQLGDLRTTLAPAHPTVIALEAKIEAASQPSAEVIALENEERIILLQIANANGAVVKTPALLASTQGPRPRLDTPFPPPPVQPEPASQPTTEDAVTALARTRLQSATMKYEELMGRITHRARYRSSSLQVSI